MAASSGAVRAGKAFVEIFGDDSKLRATLGGIGGAIKAGIGGAATVIAAGAAGLTALGAAAFGTAMSFSKAASDIDDMSQRTGVSAKALQELGYAARQSGTDSATLETGFKKMQKTLADAAGGSKQAKKALSDLGFSVSDLAGLSPDKQFEAISGAIAGISDPAMRTAAAMDIFGKSGTQLLPLMQSNLSELRAEAERLGLVLSDKDVAAGARLDDTLQTLWDTLSALKNTIGAALAPAMQAFSDMAINATAAVIQWINSNREVFDVIGEIAELLASGQVQAAADLFWAGLNLAWLEGTQNLRDVFREMSGWIADIWFDMLRDLKAGIAVFADAAAEALSMLTGFSKREFIAEPNLEKKLAKIIQERKDNKSSLDDELKARKAAADAALEAARKDFAATRSRVQSLLPEKGGASPGNIDEAMQASKALGLAAGFGSFSTAALGQIGVGGLGSLEDVARDQLDKLEEIADNTRGGMVFA